jgi:thiazole/oxazole-forming peptide maturase SagD family component
VLFKPILVVPAISKDDRIKFILPDQEIALEEKVTSDAWAILELCNGLNSVDTITELLTNIDDEFIVGFLNDLNSLKIIADSRKLYERFHAVSSNPTIYPSDITDAEIAEHVRSPRRAVKTGKVFTFNQSVNSELAKLQDLRTSCRNFTGEPLSIHEIGSVLELGYSFSRHAVPSAGNLYPMKIFLVALEDQQDMPAGYYEYDNEKNRLVLFNDRPDSERIHYAFNDVEMPFGASIVLVIAADANRQPHKYSNRGYRFMAIEAGHIAQNITLGAVEHGLATCELGSMLDGMISDELELADCLPFVAIAVGKESSTPRLTSSHLLAKFEAEMVGDEKAVQSAWLVDDTFSSNFEKSYFQILALTQDGQITSGISTSWADAKLKAIAEGYERQRSADVQYDIRSSADDLPGEWLDPRIVTPLTDKQYDHLPYLQKFDESLEIEWVKGFSYTGQEVFVPIDLVYYPIKDIDRKLIVDTCSSGFAAYTDVEEAVNRGVLEIIERDALMRSWYEKKSPRKLDSKILPTHLQKRVEYWRKEGHEVYVLDLSQNGVIIIEVVITSDSYPCFVSGASSSLGTFEETAVKAFQEAESRLIYGLNELSERSIQPNNVHSVLDHELLYAQSKQYHGYVQFLFDGTLSNSLPTATVSMEILKELLETVVVDVSEENSLLKVVKVLSPKMIPISFGHGTDHYSHHSLTRAVDGPPTVPHYFA